jgi:hypothetical protein
MILTPTAGDYIRLEVAKTGLMRGKKHVFLFPAYRGEAQRQPEQYRITLDARRVECKDDWIKPGDLKKVLEFTLKDMLDAERHPEIRYDSTTAILQLRGKSAPVGVSYRESSPGVFEGSAVIDMRAFGLKPPSAALGAVGTDPMMRLSFRITPREG